MRHPSLLFVRLLNYNLSLYKILSSLKRLHSLVLITVLFAFSRESSDSSEQRIVHTTLFDSGVGFLTPLCAKTLISGLSPRENRQIRM